MKKSVKYLEKTGGALPVEQEAKPVRQKKNQPELVESYQNVDVYHYKDTPAKKIYRQLHENWRGGIFKGQVQPQFALMKKILDEHDDTSFEEQKFEIPLPDVAPTGRGAQHDHPETAHFVHSALMKINPILAKAYMGGAIHNDYEEHLNRTDFQFGRNGYHPSRDSKYTQHRLFGAIPAGPTRYTGVQPVAHRRRINRRQTR